MDIAGLDAVVRGRLPRAPGRRSGSSPGRAGRARDEALVVLVARDDPMDTYLVHHPEALLGAPVEGCVLDPHNPYVLAPQLVCAAAELPLTERDVADVFGGAGGRGRARRAGRRRCAASPAHRLVLALDPGATGRLGGHPRLGPGPGGPGRGGRPGGCSARWTAASAPATAHAGAVYLHRGESYLVESLDLDAGVALVRAADPDWRTDARSSADVEVARVLHAPRPRARSGSRSAR